LGLAGLAVEAVALTPLGIRLVQLVTADPDAARCPECGQVSTSGKEWTLTRPRDLPVGGEPVLLGVAQAALAVSDRGVSAAELHQLVGCWAGGRGLQP
jgi:transposase